MKFSQFFIHRPKFAWVVALIISLAGILALPNLPVSQYPNVAPPQISITAIYPGASAQVLVDSVTSVIEEELNGAENLLYYESTSSGNGMAEIIATFEPGTNPQLAQVEIQNRLKKAEASLPQVVLNMGVEVEQTSAGFLIIYALSYQEGTSIKDSTALSDFAARNINNELLRVPGVGKLQFFSTEAALRIWLDLNKMHAYGLSTAQVNQAIASQNVQVAAGSFGGAPTSDGQEVTATLAVKGTLDSPEEFGQLVVHSLPDGSLVRLKDVARIEIGNENYNFASRIEGQPAVAAALQLAPGANAIETSRLVREKLKELSVNFPTGVEYSFPFDSSLFVDAAIEKVLYTLVEAMVLVFLVMFLFLQNFRYTLIPALVVPVCLLGTAAIMYTLGFSVNMMTMFGMVLAIGILVDDAIVVVENVDRLITEEGLAPIPATIKAMSQVGGAIVGITLVLAAVFLPLAFMSGSVGVIYRQFSLALGVSIIFSGFLALTFTPALCATLLKGKQTNPLEKKGFFGAFNRGFNKLTNGYMGLNNKLVRRAGRLMLVYLVIIGVLAFFYVRLPEAFVPVEDQGYAVVDIQLPPNANFERTTKVIEEFEDFMRTREALEKNILVMGFSFSGMGENAAMAFPGYKDWSERTPEQHLVNEVGAINGRFAHLEDGQIMAVMPPPIDGLGNAGGFALRLQDRSGLGREALLDAMNQILYKANTNPKFMYAIMDGMRDAPQLRLDIDREKALALGVSFSAINDTLSTAFGSAILNDFMNQGRQQRVVVQAEGYDRKTPEAVLSLYAPNNQGELVPFSAFATTKWEEGPVQLVRYNGYPSVRIAGDSMPWVSSGEIMAELEAMLAELPEGLGHEWTQLSYQERLASGQAGFLIGLSILVVFLVLVALYESWLIPLAVLLIVPVGVTGSVLTVTMLGLNNDVYFKVGLITIIGLAAKNAILIIEFARSRWYEGISLVDAAVEAARLRFRPILMTSSAFTLGVVPLALATGAGSASQHTLGVGVIGGMVMATILGVVFIPIFFVWVLAKVKQPKAPVKAELI